jgi:hypothetical protein
MASEAWSKNGSGKYDRLLGGDHEPPLKSAEDVSFRITADSVPWCWR